MMPSQSPGPDFDLIGDKWVLRDGCRVRMDIFMIDSAGRVQFRDAAAAPPSIDEAIKAAIEQAAKNLNLKPSEYLASLAPAQLEKLINGVVTQAVQAAGGAGIAKAFALDAQMQDAEVQTIVARERRVHDTRFAFMGDRGPTFDADRALFLAKALIAANTNRATRDAALAGQHDVMPVLDRSEVDQARAQMIADMQPGVHGAAMRDAARLSQYR